MRQNRVSDLAGRQSARPLQPRGKHLVALDEQRALLADPLLDQPLSQG